MKNTWLVIIVSALVSLPIFATDIYVSSLPVMQGILHASDYMMKLSLNAYMLGFALTTLGAGILSDALSKYKILMTGLLVFLISSLVIAHAQSVAVLVYGRGFQGLGGGTGTVLARLILKERLHAEKGLTQLKALSIVGANMALSPLIGPLLGASLTRWFGWQSIFYFLGAVACILFCCVLYLHQSNAVITVKHPIHPKVLLAKYRHVLQMKLFLFPTMAISLVCAAEFIFISNSAFYYQNIIGLNPFVYSVLLSCILFGFVIGTWILDRAIKVIPTHIVLKRTIQVCCLVALLPIIGWFGGGWSCAILLALSMLIAMAGLGIIIPLTQSIALNMAGGGGAAIAGLFFFIEFLAIGLAGYLVSLFSSPALPMILGLIICWAFLWLGELCMNGEAILENPV